jgi:transcription antitermination protein NusB
MTAPITIAATVTATQLSEAIGRDLVEVAAVLESRGEPHAPDDVISAEVAVAVARALGVRVAIEPRDLALEYLYARETMGEPGPLQGRAGALADGILADLDGLDARIEAVSEHWSVSRMPVIDRNILRIALHELESHPDIPTGVVISEAIRLASTYSTERSASFVNGVLSSLAKRVRGL